MREVRFDCSGSDRRLSRQSRWDRRSGTGLRNGSGFRGNAGITAVDGNGLQYVSRAAEKTPGSVAAGTASDFSRWYLDFLVLHGTKVDVV
jgi:hypothetical protein